MNLKRGFYTAFYMLHRNLWKGLVFEYSQWERSMEMSLSLYVDSSLMMVDDHPQSHWMSCMLLSNQRQDGSKTTRVQLSQSSRWEQTVSWTCPFFLLKSGFWTLTLCKECSFFINEPYWVSNDLKVKKQIIIFWGIKYTVFVAV